MTATRNTKDETPLDPDNINCGRRVRIRMATQGVTQDAAAAHIGISQPQLHHRLEGRVAFRIAELKKIAELLDTTVQKLT